MERECGSRRIVGVRIVGCRAGRKEPAGCGGAGGRIVAGPADVQEFGHAVRQGARVEGARWADIEPARAQGSGESQGKGGLEPQVLQLVDAREHLLRRPLAYDGAVLQHDDAVGGERVVHEMRDVDDGDAALAKIVDAGHDVGSTCGVQHGAGLIEEQRSRSHRQGSRDRHALALSAREVGGVAARLCGHAHGCKGLGDAFRDLRPGDAEVLGPEGDIVLDDARDHLVLGILQNERDVATRGARGGPAVRDVAARDPDAAGIGGDQAVHELEQRGFTRPVAAEHAEPLAGHDAQAHALKRGTVGAGIGVGGIGDLDEGRVRVALPSIRAGGEWTAPFDAVRGFGARSVGAGLSCVGAIDAVHGGTGSVAANGP